MQTLSAINKDVIKASLLLPPFGNCKNCNHVLAIFSGEELIETHFNNKKCPSCKSIVDTWDMTLKYLNDNPLSSFMHAILAFTGFEGIILDNQYLKPFDIYNVDLTNFGIPDTAKIWSVNLTSTIPNEPTSFRPLLIHGNLIPQIINPRFSVYGAILNIDSIKQNIELYGRDISTIDTTVKIKFNIFVIYIDKSKLDLPAEYISHAAESYMLKNMKDAIIKLSIASEILISDVCEIYWQTTGIVKEVTDPQKNIDYIKKLQIHLPKAAKLVSENKIDMRVRKALNELNHIRNLVMHTRQQVEINSRNCNELFTAVLFLKYHCSLLIKKLNDLNL